MHWVQKKDWHWERHWVQQMDWQMVQQKD